MRAAEVVVVGAGYAGLAAARLLQQGGIDVVVLEARERVGGRVLTEQVRGRPVDLGGQWLGPGQTRVASLAREYGVGTYPTHADGDALLVDGERRRRFTGPLPPTAPHVAAAVAVTVLRLERMAAGVDVERPWTSRAAARRDATTVAGWLRGNVPVPEARRLMSVALAEVMATDVDTLSLLGFLFSVKAAGGLEPLLAVEGGAQQDLFADGADAIPRAIAADLGSAVLLSTPVTAIRQTATGVEAGGPGATVTARRAIVALPPPLAGRIAYEPPLPAARDHLTQRMPMGSIMKAIAIYDRPFWRDQGLAGEVLCLDGPVPAAFDVSPPGGPGYLCALIPGRAAHRLGAMDGKERRRVVLDALARFYGPRAARPLEWRDKVWADDPYSRGGYGAYFPPGVVTSVGEALRAPVGRIHWAGTETATTWAGYIEGAIRSGERAAREVAPVPMSAAAS